MRISKFVKSLTTAKWQSVSCNTVISQSGNLAIILGVIVLVLIFGGTYYYQTQKNSSIIKDYNRPVPYTKKLPQSELKTYQSLNSSFSVEYPSEWITKEFIVELAQGAKTNGVAFRPQAEIQDQTWGIVTIEVGDIKASMTLDNYINTYMCNSPEVCANSENVMNMTIGGTSAKKVIGTTSPVPSQVVLGIKDNKIYVVRLTLDKSFEDLYTTQDKEEIFNRMLSSFKFTN